VSFVLWGEEDHVYFFSSEKGEYEERLDDGYKNTSAIREWILVCMGGPRIL
jgi:hypothetical protein